MKYSFEFRKMTSVATLATFLVSIFSPLANIAFAASPTVDLSYSANPTGTGVLVITATYSETIVGSPLISIDQPGSSDILDDTMVDLGTGSIFTYNYTVNLDNGSIYMDGVANVSLTGAYNGSGEIADPATNATFIIETLDTEAPVISLSGSSSVDVEYGSSFVDLGATWTDNVDGIGFIGAYNSGSINTGSLGSYVVSYEYSDVAGNAGTGATRTVNVVDTTAPVVTLSGSTPVVVVLGNDFSDDGATWTDAVDGSGFIGSYNSGSVNTGSLGSYVVSYGYVDGSGNTGSVDRVVNVVAAPDTEAPVISLSGSSSVDVEYGSSFVDLGATWTDNVDGIGFIGAYNSGSINTGSLGSYVVSYEYSDVAGNAGTGATRTVNVVDTTAPVVTLSGSTPVVVVLGNDFSDDGATWTDAVDGSGFIGSYNSGSVNTGSLGSYVVSYGYVDGSGNTGSVDRVVNVVAAPDTEAPVISLSGSSSVDVEYGSSFVDLGATWTDNVDGIGFIGAYNSGSINTGSLGSYVVSYEYSDVAGNAGTGATRTVNVVDTTAPVVTLSGSTPVVVVLGNDFSDDGATWTDAVDGSGFIGSYNSGSVNTGSLGSYVVSYGYVDGSGNTGSVDRVVNVVAAPDTEAPVISLSGSSSVDVEYGSSFVDLGATWTDNVDGIGFIGAYNSGSINTGSLGSYVVSYEYSDVAGNAGTGATRTVNVVDTTAPVVTLSGSTPVVVVLGNDFSDDGATWTDAVDGSGFIGSYNSGSVNTGSLGSYVVSYGYVDGSGNTGSVDRVVNVVAAPDTEAPVISLSGSSSVDVEYGSSFVDLGATWTDNVDGIGFIGAYNSGSINTGSLGSYVVSYEYSDVAGNAGTGATRTVNVVDTTAPVVTLSGSTPVVVVLGNDFSDDGATWTDAVDGSGFIGSYNSGSVNTGSLGSYVVSYGYVDGSGNTGSVDRVVNVVAAPDTEAPVISLSGSSSVDVEYGSSFVDLGATWTDNVDGIGFIGAYNSGSINTGSLGSYVVSYEYSDVAGNAGTGATRTVNVVDTTAPVVTLSGSTPVVVVLGNDFSDDGATWTDAVDGSGFIGSYNSGSVNTGSLGSYVVSYGYVDGSGNTGSVDRVVNVVAAPDTEAPVISLSGSSSVDVEYGSSFVDLGATWTDNVDGIGFIGAYNSGSINTGSLGSYVVSYEYSDVAGNAGTGATRTVNVVDTTAPVVTLSGSTPVVVVLGNDFSDDGATWTDAVDGSGFIGSYNSGSVNTGSLGSYVVSYGYVDGSGNTGSVDRVVNVVAAPDTEAPVISLSGSSSVDVEYGSSFVDLGATWTDNVDGIGFIGAYNSGSINTGSLGSYVVSYEYSDVAGNAGTGATRTVNVVDTTAPVVTLSGSTPVVVVLGNDFSDDGATWTDAVDGSGFIGSYNSGSVNTGSLGSYVVSYGYVDGSGNTGSVDRVVNVVAAPDTEAPVISLSGSSSVDVEYGSSFVDLGATWTDNVDGIGFIGAYNSGSINTGSLGSYVVSYEYSDVAGNAGTGATRTVNVVDTTAPVVTLSGSTPVVVVLGNDFSDDGATWTDAVDGSGFIGSYNSGSVNTGSLGSYVVSYGYVDGSGNTGSVDRVVNVVAAPDTEAPVISLSGSSSVDVEYGSSFVDLGATWTDNVDGIGFIGAYNSGSINTGSLGSYVVSYEYSDVAGNAGTGATRTVNVVDTTAPVVTLSGSTPVVVVLGNDFSDDGATWTDAVDGSGFIGSYNSGSVNTGSLGSYVVSYGYVDGSGNTGSVDRVVNVVAAPDTEAPVISLSGSSSVDVEYGSSFVDLGATWTDNVDGIGFIGAYNSGSINTGSLGSYVVSYEYSDVAGNAGTGATRTVNVVDTTAPVVTLSGSTPVVVVLGNDFSDDGATWTDAVDGSGFIGSYNSGSVNTGSLGSYVVSYGYVDGSGNTGSVDRVVNVVAAPDTEAPVISLSGSSSVDVEYGSSFVDLGATWTDNVDGIGFIGAYNSGSINTGSLGSYVVSYEYSDVAGNAGTGATRTVNVVDTTAPVVTLSGSTPVVVVLGNDFSDDGATWTDAVDGSGFIGSYNSGSVNTGSLGSYVVSYGYVDGSGNTGSVDRVVNVVAATLPISSGGGGGSSSYISTSIPNSQITSNTTTPTMTTTIQLARELGIMRLQKILNKEDIILNAAPTNNHQFHDQENSNGKNPVIQTLDILGSAAEKSIKTLITRGILKNVDKFEPKREITRAEFIKILTLVLGLEETVIVKKISFDDVDSGSEFRRYINIALDLGWINPNQKSFRPNDKITLGEVKKIIHVAVGIADANTPAELSGTITREDAIILIDKDIGIN